jgi:ketosteroid isomerase-like protein
VSQENVEVVRRSNAAFNSGDLDGTLADFDPDIDWRDLQHAPDTPERVRGVAAVSSIMDEWEGAYDDFTAEIEEYIDAGVVVVTVTHWHAKGKGSGLALDLRTADVFEFADRKIVRVTLGYSDKREALKAVGLEE